MVEIDDPIGLDKKHHVQEAATRADVIVVGYGQPKIEALRARGSALADLLQAAGYDLYVLELASGVPKHPLYIRDGPISVMWKREKKRANKGGYLPVPLTCVGEHPVEGYHVMIYLVMA